MFRTVRDLYLTHEQPRTLFPPSAEPRHYLIYINELVLRVAGSHRQHDSALQKQESRRLAGAPGAPRTAHPVRICGGLEGTCLHPPGPSPPPPVLPCGSPSTAPQLFLSLALSRCYTYRPGLSLPQHKLVPVSGFCLGSVVS